MSDMLKAAQELRPMLKWHLDDEGNVSSDAELTTTIYSFGGGACMVMAQMGCFVIATARAESLREALDEVDRLVAVEAANPASMLVALRKLKELAP